MIDYNIALLLKNAGFPQPEEPKTGHYDSWILKETYGDAYFLNQTENKVFPIKTFPGMCYIREYVYVPSLLELIKECGDKFESLHYFSNTKKWGTNKFECCLDCTPEGWDNYETTGESAEEAVAELYLKINKK